MNYIECGDPECFGLHASRIEIDQFGCFSLKCAQWELAADWIVPDPNLKHSFPAGVDAMYGAFSKSVDTSNGERLKELATESARKQALGGRYLPATFVFDDNSEAAVLIGPRTPARKPDPDAP